MRLFLRGFFPFLLVVFCAGVISAQEPATPSKGTIIKTPLEKSHVPVIRIPDNVQKGELFMVTVQVGETIHEMKKEHFIEWIEGFVNQERIFRLTLTPSVAEPRITIPLRIDQNVTLKIEERCSKHGIWGSEVQIRPSDSPDTGGKAA